MIPFELKPVHAQKKVHTEFNFDAANEVKPLPLSPVQAHADAKVDVSASAAAAAVPVAPTIIIRDVSPAFIFIGIKLNLILLSEYFELLFNFSSIRILETSFVDVTTTKYLSEGLIWRILVHVFTMKRH